ncbi:AraC family transcriptional regulator [Nocardioides panacisoli]|uniref:AraC family transcriptional regulator n=1 Tax=Nocardioides panacisoli TaxID=627624 RepID=UPI001C62FEF5|nr:AraC family transcriptional regulator [Nocardioides panacisoli]QYJ03444.1 AraC family transcriptional regulator [Nocardioides panacisoli]
MTTVEGSGGSRGVTTHYARALLQAAEHDGVALPADLAARVRGAERVPLAWQDELWEAYCAGSGDPLAGLRLGRRIEVGHLDSPGVLLATCDTLGEALEELAAYVPVIGEGSFELRRDVAPVRAEYTHPRTTRHRERTEAVLASLLHLARWATGGRFGAVAVAFTHEPLAPAEEYEAELGAPVRFAAAYDALVCDADQLDLPLVQANPALHDHLRELVDRTLAGLDAAGPGPRVQQVVREHPDWGRDRVAAELAVSSRHLNRLLGEEGLTFKAVRERALADIAVRALDRGDRVVDVAARLGYSDETAFSRAFRRWRGTTPGQYRDRSGRGGTTG